MALTELKIKHLKPKEKVYRVTDNAGLVLEISPSGGKLWRWRYYYQGKAQMLALGKYPLISLAEARRKRDENAALLESGKHPTREKKAEKLRKVVEGQNTFKKATHLWIEAKGQGFNPKYIKQCLSRLEQHVFPHIGDLPLIEIAIPDVVSVVDDISKQGAIETARRMKQLIGQIFRYAAQRGLCQHNPASDLRDILPRQEEKHHASIHPNELPALLEKIEERDSDFTKYAIKLLMLTFVRTNELIAAEWSEIHWNKAQWWIPKERMKMRRPHVVPLSKQVITLLKELHTVTGHKKHIFHSAASKSQHISNGTVLMGLRRMGYQNKMTGHGFRHLASTILNEQSYTPDAIERQLAHSDDDKIRSDYNRAEHLPERIKMMQDYADYLDQLLANKDEKIIRFTA